MKQLEKNWEALLEQCKKDAAAQEAANDWYRNVWLNMTEEEQKEYV